MVRVESLVLDSTVDVRDVTRCTVFEWAYAATTTDTGMLDAAIPLFVYSCFDMHQPSARL